MQATSLVSPRGDGEEFFLDILFHRVSVNAILRQQCFGRRFLRLQRSPSH